MPTAEHNIGDLVLYYNHFSPEPYILGIIKAVDQWEYRLDGTKRYSYIVDWCDPVVDVGKYSSESIEEFKADLYNYLNGMRVMND